jgi:hypothetical protein
LKLVLIRPALFIYWRLRRVLINLIARGEKRIKALPVALVKNGELFDLEEQPLAQAELACPEIPFPVQHLYFTSSSLGLQDDGMAFIGSPDKSPNLFWVEFSSNQLRPLTHNTNGVMKSYVYFKGKPYKGLSKASPCFHPATKTLYYIQDQAIHKVELDG